VREERWESEDFHSNYEKRGLLARGEGKWKREGKEKDEHREHRGKEGHRGRFYVWKAQKRIKNGKV
jgi:hypothetical protein